MTTIYLDASKPYSGFSSVSRLDFSLSKLFVKYRHQPSQHLGNQYLYVYKKYVWYLAAYATINPTGAYSDASYDYFEVFYNSLDTAQNRPLLLLIHFKNPSRHNKRFVVFSKLRNIIDNRAVINVSDLGMLDKTNPDYDLLRKLLFENDRIGFISTFVIDYIQMNTSYNDGKINVKYMVSPPDAHYYLLKMGHTIQKAGLMCFSHVPSQKFKSNQCTIVYEHQFLIGPNGSPLYELQGDIYGFINVYWSTKLHLPLLVELNYERTPDFKYNKFYFNVTSGGSVFWKLLEPDDYTRLTTLRFLHHDTMYNQLFVDSTTPVIILLLQKLEFDLFSSIILFVDIFNGTYGEYDIDRSEGNHDQNFVHKRGTVSVSNIVSKKDGTCLHGTDFRVYEHDFDHIIKNIQYGNPNYIKLKLVTSNIERFNTNYPTIYIDKKTYMGYMFGSIQILVSDNYNSELNYKWYKHSSENDILKDNFRLEYKGQSVFVNFDRNTHQASPKLLYVYFRRDNDDIFVLVAFPSEDQTKIWYLTYDDFKKAVKNNNPIKLSGLTNVKANTKSDYYGQSGSRSIDSDLQRLLDKEKANHCVLYIKLDNTHRVTYHSEYLEINVSEHNDRNLNSYRIINHQFTTKIRFYDISFNSRASSKILDITGYFDNEHVNKVSAYFHKTEPEIPLLICLSSTKQKKYFKYSEFFYNVNNPVKLSDLEEIKEPDIQSKLKDQFESLNNILIFNLSSSDNYANVKVTEAKPYGSFKYHIHTPREYFKYIKLEDNNLQLNDFNPEAYTHEILLDCTVYYHGFDKENKCPLIIEFYTNRADKRYRAALINPQNISGISATSIFYGLNLIDERTFKKTYTQIKSPLTDLAVTLREIYFKFNWKIDPLIKVKGYDAISTFFYKYTKNKLYVYFYKNDPRVLAFCYDNKAYKRYFLDGNISKWINVPGLNSCICNKTRTQGQTQIDPRILDALKDVANSFGLIKPEKPVKLRPETRIPDSSVQIDLLKKGIIYENSTISVSSKQFFTESDLFCYYSHYRVDQSLFTISSFVSSHEGTKVTHSSKTITNVKSVSVYFNTYYEFIPLIIEILNDSKSVYYEIGRSGNNYTIHENRSLIKGSELCEKLIELSDKYNQTSTFQIDKFGEYNGINVSSDQKSSHQFTIYKHLPSKPTPSRSCVLYQYRLFVVDSSIKTSNIVIQDSKYQSINVYVLNIDFSPLLVELKDQNSKSTFFSRKDSDGTFKLLENFNSSVDADVKNKLSETYYFLRKSVMLELNRVSDSSYDVRLIENKPKPNSFAPLDSDYSLGIKTRSLKIIKVVKKDIVCPSKSPRLFKCYQHDLTDLTLSSEVTLIGGLRLYFSQTNNTDNMSEIELFKSSSATNNNRMFLYSTPGPFQHDAKNKFNVYFFGEDLRPLLFTYDDKAYLQIHGNQWYHDNKIDCKDECNILNKLYELFEKFKGKLIFMKDGDITNINITPEKTFGNFRMKTYTPHVLHRDQHRQFKLPKKELIGQTKTNSNIDNLLDKLDRLVFDTVNVYMVKNRQGQSIKEILLIEFIFDSNKTHFKRKDPDGNYWVKDLISYTRDNELQKELQIIQDTIGATAVYELDSKSSFNSNISLSSESVVGSRNEFTKYIYKPDYVPKSSLIFYKKEKLFKKVRNQYKELTEIENYQHSSLIVYFGSKVTTGNKNCPLIFELNQDDYSSTFYLHKRDEIKHYWEEVYITSSSYSNELVDKLGETQFNLVDSIVLLMDKFTDAYGDREIRDAKEKLTPTKEIHLAPLDDNNIKLNRSRQHTSCVTNYGFKMINHYIASVKENQNYGLRFFIPISNIHGKYNELTLYDSNGLVKEYLYYDLENKEVHFFYYGNDPRPLLLCYGGSAYRATRIEDYFEKWCRDDFISSCLCHSGRDNPTLLKALSDVVGILNTVKLEIEPVSPIVYEMPKQQGLNTVDYEVQTYAGNKINVRVSYANGSCYRLYKHEPIGTSEINHGFRLGNLSYEGRYNILINYNLRKQLKAVTVYYSLFDTGHRYPLLVILEFSSNDEKQFFELNDYQYIKWQPINDKIADTDIEYRVKQIVDKLGVQFNKSENVPTLFARNECYEDSNNTTIIGAASGTLGTMATVGTGVGVTAAVHPEWFIPVIRALI